jgi:LPXTG-motif cell wall-anchored protein
VAIVDGSSTSDYAYSPSAITVDAGSTVTWTNQGHVPEGHTVTGSGFDSGVLRNGQSYSHTFSTTGTFSYVCSLHPFMKGSVTVQAVPPPPAGDPSGGGSSGGGSGGGSQSPPPAGDPTTTPQAPAPVAGSESAAGGTPAAAGNGRTLPITGSSSWILAGIGAALVMVGVALSPRRRQAALRISV